MPRQFKVNACLIVVLTLVFYLFWQVCKQQPALARVAPFTEDPYDAVGTFATQFAVFASFLSLVRAFRSYQPDTAGDSQRVLLVRGAYFTCVSVAVTLGADIVAMLRHPSLWVGLPAGALLAALIGGMALLTVLVGWHSHFIANKCRAPSTHQGWARAIGVSLLGMLIFVVYPESLRQSILGELLTVAISILLSFAIVWAWGMALAPSLERGGEDFIDDLWAIYRWLKVHMGHFSVVLIPVEKIAGSSFLRPIVRRLNPRRHRWNAILLCGLCIGAVLALVEALAEGGPGPRFALFAAIFVGIEVTGVLVGYAFLATPLGLFRHASEGKI
ncbi:MAG: hypothetical protein H0W02_16405 [Ktedonobacteraceae bacterium]|nr:hypothetical protein [Ktedonobacteraceae bacterium]